MHALDAVDPAALHKPLLQAAHAVAPNALEYVPPPQTVHVEASVAPIAVAYVPPTHDAHVEASVAPVPVK